MFIHDALLEYMNQNQLENVTVTRKTDNEDSKEWVNHVDNKINF